VKNGGNCRRRYWEESGDEFLSAEGYCPIEIHRGLKSVYGEDATDVSADRRRVYRLKGGENDICERAHSDRSFTAATTETKGKVDARQASSKLRAICADKNSKSSAKQDDESNTPAQRQTTHQSAQKGGKCKNEVNCSPSLPLNPELATSVFHIFASMKDALRRRRLVEDDQLKQSAR
jgi:hypothetical protein